MYYSIQETVMLRKLFNKITEMQRRRTAYWQLQNLTDQQLHDIGVSRSEIYRTAYKDPIR